MSRRHIRSLWGAARRSCATPRRAAAHSLRLQRTRNLECSIHGRGLSGQGSQAGTGLPPQRSRRAAPLCNSGSASNCLRFWCTAAASASLAGRGITLLYAGALLKARAWLVGKRCATGRSQHAATGMPLPRGAHATSAAWAPTGRARRRGSGRARSAQIAPPSAAGLRGKSDARRTGGRGTALIAKVHIALVVATIKTGRGTGSIKGAR